MDWWPAVVFGWPGPILALLLSAIGITAGRRSWLVAAAVVLLPFALYLAASPRTRWLGALPVIPLLGAAAISRGSSMLAWLSVLVLCAGVSWVAWVVATSAR